ncbi:MAG: hypothetical protein RR922_03130 [Clostridia bacterium]
MNKEKILKAIYISIAAVLVLFIVSYLVYNIYIKQNISQQAIYKEYVEKREIVDKANVDVDGYTVHKDMAVKVENMKVENSKISYDLKVKVLNKDISSDKLELFVGASAYDEAKTIYFMDLGRMPNKDNKIHFSTELPKEIYNKRNPKYTAINTNNWERKNISIDDKGVITQKFEQLLTVSPSPKTINLRIFAPKLVVKEDSGEYTLPALLDYPVAEWQFSINI